MKSLARCSRAVFFTLGLGSVLVLAATPGRAGESETAGAKERPWSVEIAGGVEYDDNVSVAELDETTGLGDFAGVIDFRADYAPELGENTSLYVGYDFFQSLYVDLTGFDIQSHVATVSLDHTIGRVTVGGMYNFAYAFLGGDDFLEFHKFSPFVSVFLTDSLYLRSFYEYTDKSIFPSPDRDTQDQGGGASLYYFMNGAKTYVSAGYRYESVDAVGPEFDYAGHDITAKFSTHLALGDAASEIKIGGRYDIRDYENVTASIGEIRDDDIFKLTAEWEIPLGKYLFSELKYEYGNYISNLPTADYTRNVATIKLGARY